MTGIEALDALMAVTHEEEHGSKFLVHPEDGKDLRKLKISDLMSREFSEREAEEVSSALLHNGLEILGRALGLDLSESYDAPRLRRQT